MHVALWRQRLKAGFGPLTIGLVLTNGVVLARGAAQAMVTLGVSRDQRSRTAAHQAAPLLLIAAAAAIGLTRALAPA